MMNLETTQLAGWMVVALKQKRLLAQDAPSFKEQVLEIVNSSGSRVALDLQDVEFVDSSGLGALVAIYKQAQKTEGLALCSLQDNVLSLLKLTRMDRVFKIYESVDNLKDAEP